MIRYTNFIQIHRPELPTDKLADSQSRNEVYPNFQPTHYERYANVDDPY